MRRVTLASVVNTFPTDKCKTRVFVLVAYRVPFTFKKNSSSIAMVMMMMMMPCPQKISAHFSWNALHFFIIFFFSSVQVWYSIFLLVHQFFCCCCIYRWALVWRMCFFQKARSRLMTRIKKLLRSVLVEFGPSSQPSLYLISFDSCKDSLRHNNPRTSKSSRAISTVKWIYTKFSWDYIVTILNEIWRFFSRSDARDILSLSINQSFVTLISFWDSSIWLWFFWNLILDIQNKRHFMFFVKFKWSAVVTRTFYYANVTQQGIVFARLALCGRWLFKIITRILRAKLGLLKNLLEPKADRFKRRSIKTLTGILEIVWDGATSQIWTVR